MPGLTESDLVRIRQFIQKLEKQIANGDFDGLNVYITYHDADLDAMPSNPIGDGTTGGWHTDVTAYINWMSTKTAKSQSEGTWSNPIAIRGLKGDDAIIYYIKPLNATALKNGEGTITIEAHRIIGGIDVKLTSGTIKLYDPDNNIVSEANGYCAGSDGYTGILDATDINNVKVITLKNGPTGTPLDTITLVDVYDGIDGEAIVGSINSDNGLAWVQAPGPGAWTPSGTTTTLTVTFYQNGIAINTRTVVITRSNATLTAPTPDTVDGITYARIGNGTSAITITFQHIASGVRVSETVYAIAGAINGEDGSDGTGLSADIPFLKGITFIGSTVSGKVGWTAGTLEYKGTVYNITGKAVDDGSTNAWIYWDADDQNTTFKTTNSLATAIADGNWVVCWNNAGKAVPAAAHKVLLAGLIQADTLSAISAFLGNITSGQLLLTHSDSTRKFRFDNLGIYISNDGTNFLPVLYNDGGVIKLSADQIKVGTLSVDRIANSAINTEKLADNAAINKQTQFVSAFSDWLPTITDSPNYILLASVTITSIGNGIMIFARSTIKLYYDTPIAYGSIFLERGPPGSSEKNFGYVAEAYHYANEEHTLELCFFDYPGPGTHTYYLYGQDRVYGSPPYRFKARDRYLQVMEPIK